MTDANWTEDKSGLWHWSNVSGTAFWIVSEGAAKALGTRPEGPCWFWWNDTPAPIFRDDTADALCKRWAQWREKHQAGRLLGALQSMARKQP